MDTYRIYVLGEFRIESRAGSVRPPTRKTEALLAYLVLRPGRHTRDSLATLLWGDFPDAQARASLRNALAVLRRALGDDLFLTDRETVQLNPTASLWVDALALQAQTEVFFAAALPDPASIDIDLYQGDLLTDWYDDWITVDREYYRRLYLKVLRELGQRARAGGDHQRAIDLAQRYLTLEPADEIAHQTVMLSCQALGDVHAALRQFDRCHQALREELGVEPSSATIELSNQIKRALATPRSAPPYLSNLPYPLTSFIGRETAIAEITHRLTPGPHNEPDPTETRLLTLTGPGGCGKTRLAIQVAHTLLKRQTFPDGVWWVELAALTNPAFLPQALAQVWGVRGLPDQPLSKSLASYLATKHMLVVINNCEHLVAACASLIEFLLSACPQLTILATSREALDILGETRWAVPSLTLDGDGASPEAVRLFVDRVATASSLAVTTATLPTIAYICRRLDGIPLAIELAAARVKVLSVEEIAARLNDRFALLTGGSRTALPRHQTLRATMDWSYDLLDATDQSTLRHVSVFVGGFTLAAAEAVAGQTVLDPLARLIDKSLVNAVVVEHHTRYHLLETVREYSLDQLSLAGEDTAARQRHLHWFCALAEQAEAGLRGPDQPQWLTLLDADYPNLIAALRWAAQNADATNLEAGLRLGSALWQFWAYRGYVAEAAERLAELIQLAASDPGLSLATAKALNIAGALATRRADYQTATDYLSEALTLWRRLDQPPGLGFALHYLGWLATAQGHFDQARPLFEAALTVQRARGLAGRRDMAETLTYMGLLAFLEGDYSTAQARQEEALAIKQELREVWTIAFSRWNLGNIALAQGDITTARAIYHDALRTMASLGDRWGMPHVLDGIGYSALAEGRHERTARLFGAAEALREATGTPTPPVMRTAFDMALAILDSHLGQDLLADALRAGRNMTLEQVVALALET